MKIIRKTALLFAMSSLVVTQTGCFGEFALTRKVYEFHDGISDNKFVKSLLFWIPGGLVYWIAGAADAVIFNLIEFWSGSNPLSMNEGDHEMLLTTIDGVQYKIEATKDTFTTTQLSGEQVGEVRSMKFDRCDNTWKYSDSGVRDMAIMTFIDGDADRMRIYTERGSMDLTAAEMTNASIVAAKIADLELAMAN
ncbi:MAG: DUF3332 family protein [Flavobacteriales bacterium]